MREKEYLATLIILDESGIDILSKRSVTILEESYGFTNKGPYIYRNNLKSKGWLIQTSMGLELPKAFRNIKDNIRLVISLEDGSKSTEHNQ